MESILIRREGTIATVILNGPEPGNALTSEMWRRLGAAMRELAEDDDPRCIVLRGAGDQVFSVGADIAEFAAARSNSEQARAYAALVGAALQSVAGCRHPTLALIRGMCQSEALALAAVCDMRICAESSTFSLPAGRLGVALGASELAAIYGIAGQAATLELLLEGRAFSAAEAYLRRMVNRVVPDAEVESEAYAAAGRIGAGAPLAASWNKRFVERLTVGAEIADANLEAGFACFDTEDYKIGLQAFLNNAKPEFKGR
jgi:enoyl-CoA hydratase